MTFMDALNPTTIQPSGARKVLNMSKRDDAEDLIKDAEMQKAMDFARHLKTQARQDEITAKRNKAIKTMKIRKLRDAVRTALARKEKAKREWELAVSAYEEALNA